MARTVSDIPSYGSDKGRVVDRDRQPVPPFTHHIYTAALSFACGAVIAGAAGVVALLAVVGKLTERR